MTTFPGAPRLLKGGIVLVNPTTGAVQRIITLQYNPNTLTRTLQAQTLGEDTDRSQALRLKGPPVETYKLDAEIDAAGQVGHHYRHVCRESRSIDPASGPHRQDPAHGLSLPNGKRHHRVRSWIASPSSD